ncbi:MAG: UDP-3-O-(3-hydroxymyristoyl)glucosamine N-acyltransferase [Alphaproteobacteria bacterium]|nr:UDP-3-O-(3-hydroxymyristoyl)glucosamine N-acyltransferase [Alphaproteobacteria bacterium]MCL2505263.1 UDP-3-O-(3-hydroxymyristoyl)glucosamine N-acyltransferase [Alphaproteobacteria bacterium]
MNLSLKEISAVLDGKLIGDGTVSVTKVSSPSDNFDDSSLVVAMDKKFLQAVKDSRKIPVAAVVSGNEEDSDFIANRIIVKRPRLAMALLTKLFFKPVSVIDGIHKTAVVEEGAKIGDNPSIGALCYIGKNTCIGENAVIHPQVYIGEGAVIGDNATIYSGVRIGAGTKIGGNAIIHFNAAIGADGFSFVTPMEGSVEAAKSSGSTNVSAFNNNIIKIYSLAPVVIEDDVEIGPCTNIDMGTISSTRVGKGTKICSNVQIGHNVAVGENCILCGGVGIAGSAKIGNRVVLGGAVGVADHVIIGDDAMAMAMSGIAGNIASKTIVSGVPALPRETANKIVFAMMRMPKTMEKLQELFAKAEDFEKMLEKN